MKIYKILDGMIIRPESLEGYRKDKYSPVGSHTYIAVKNEQKGRFDLYPTSHYIDPKKSADVRNKRAILMKLPMYNDLSTVYKKNRSKDIKGQPITDLSKFECVGQLTPYQQKRFKNFIATKNTPKKYLKNKK